MKRVFALLLLLSLCATAQSSNAAPPDRSATDAAKTKLHANVLKLVDTLGLKQGMQTQLKTLVTQGKQKMMEVCKRCTPEFGDEWEKRMLERLKVDDFVDVHVRVYEKYFSNDEVLEMIELANKKSEGATPSPELKKKLESVLSSVMSETMAGCTQIGAKLGGDVGGEIESEHPEWMKGAPEPGH